MASNSTGARLTRRELLRMLAASIVAVPASSLARKITPSSSAALTNKLRDFVHQHQIAGAVGLVSRSNRIVYLEAVGDQDLDAGTAMRTSTIFDMRSMTKAVTAIAVMCLVEDGKLRLQDAVSSYVPEFANIRVSEQGKGPLRPPSRPITLFDLLTHTSGMAAERPPQIENITRVLDRPLDEVVRIVATQPLQADPGGAWNYSSMGFAVLGRIVEVRSGKPYQDFVSARIFRPLEMRDSFFFPPRQKWPRIAAMYNMENGVLRRDSIDIYRRGAKYPAPEFGMFSTAHDMERLFRMMLNEGSLDGRRVLSAQSVRAMLEPCVATAVPGVSQGLAWFICVDPDKQTALRMLKGSFGDAGASGTFGWADPGQKMIRLLLMQRFGGADTERDAFMGLAASV